jgi:hypothetical protein
MNQALRTRSPLSRRLPAAIAAVALSLAVAAPAAADEDTTELGTGLATRFIEILALPAEEKQAGLADFLALEFQIVRSNGDRLDRDGYMENPASVEAFEIREVVATRSDELVVVSYLLDATVTIDGVTRTTTAPRLSTFHEVDGEWRMTSHANFSPLEDPATGAN